MFSKALENMGHSGKVNKDSLYELFAVLDKDNSGFLDKREAYVALTTVGTSLLTLTADLSMADAEYILSALDVNNDGVISREEFVEGLTKWIDERRQDYAMMKKAARKASLRKMSISVKDLQTSPLIRSGSISQSEHLLTVEEDGGTGLESILEEDASDDDDDDDEEESEVKDLTPTEIATKASMLLLGGALLVAVFSDPMCSAVSSFATASGIPAFFVAFIVTPLASNSSEAVSSLQFAAKKKRKNFNLTFSQIYGAVAMNNTMCLGLFYMLMYKNRMEWTYASETLCMSVVILVVGIISWSKKTFTTSLGISVLALYPISVLAIWSLDTFLGWQ